MAKGTNFMKIIVLSILLFTAAFTASAADPSTPEELITAMHKKYVGKWYNTLIFAQKTITWKPDGTTENGIWYEAYSARANCGSIMTRSQAAAVLSITMANSRALRMANL